LEFIQFELKNLPIALVKEQPTLYSLESGIVQAKGVENMRIQNLAITLDKVNHLLSVMKTKDPPIYPLSEKEIYAKLWTNEHSVRAQLCKVLEVLNCELLDAENIAILQQIQDLVNAILLITESSSNEAFFQANTLIRNKFLAISNLLIKIKSDCVQIQPLCDILKLYSYTKSFFTVNSSYEKITSTEVVVRACDVTGEKQVSGELSAADQAKVFYKGAKEYESSFIWGQLAGWFKQTVDKPNASLSSEKRGTLSYPDLESFLIKQPPRPINCTERQITKITMGTWKPPKHIEEEMEIEETNENGLKKKRKKIKKNTVYPIGNREEFFEKILQSPSSMWGAGNNWAYKNKEKLYGSVQFESVKIADMKNSENKWEYLKEIIDKILSE